MNKSKCLMKNLGHIFIMSVLIFQWPHYKVICPPIFLKGDFPTFLSSPGTRTVTARFSVDSSVCWFHSRFSMHCGK